MNKRKNNKRRDTREYRVSVRAVRRESPDVNKLARAIIDLAMAQAEADAEQQKASEETGPAKDREATDE